MMKVAVRNMNGEQVEEISLLESIFDIEPNKAVMHQALVRQLANARQGTHSTKTRSEVSRSGSKIWRQKGTGRARQGSRRAPHWVGGGIAFGPKPRKYTKDMPKKMRRLAIRSALAAKAQAGQLVILDDLQFAAPKTKDALSVLKNLGVSKSAIVLVGAVENEENIKRSFNNLQKVKTLHWQYINVRDLLGHEHLIVPIAALRRIEELWG
ncbi:MAG: 50S ribosomal protein L4 [Ardenticatenales bacterium]|nr:50S ribosomal protein L4 [Ardenticatenales bacterium]